MCISWYGSSLIRWSRLIASTTGCKMWRSSDPNCARLFSSGRKSVPASKRTSIISKYLLNSSSGRNSKEQNHKIMFELRNALLSSQVLIRTYCFNEFLKRPQWLTRSLAASKVTGRWKHLQDGDVDGRESVLVAHIWICAALQQSLDGHTRVEGSWWNAKDLKV